MVEKRKRVGKIKFFYFAWGLIAVLLVCGIFLFLPVNLATVYVFPENPKQGDTVFIRIKTDANSLTGNINGQNLVFYKKGSLSEWISFFGVDADQKPGNYNILVNTSKSEHFLKSINVSLAAFSSSAITSAPSPNQPGMTKKKVAESIVKIDNSALNKVLGKFTPKPYFSEPFSFPLDKIENSGFSFGKFIGFAAYKLQHFGVDLRASEKTNIYAVNDGKVVMTLNLPDYGKTVVVDHGLDIFSLYLHLEEFKVSVGDMVKRGQTIGLSGDSGYATAPHLHFSIRVGNSRVDPLVFIKTTQQMDENMFTASIANIFNNIIK